MTKYLLLLVTLLFSITWCYPQEKMQAISAVNVRDTPSSNGEVIGVLSEGNVVDVQEKQKGWSKIKYNQRDGWVSSKYLSKDGLSPKNSSSKGAKSKESESKWFDKLNFDLDSYLDFENYDYSAAEATFNKLRSIHTNPITLIVILVVMSALMFFLSPSDGYMSEWKMWTFTALMVAESILVLFYMITTPHPTWFCMPSDVGWVVAIIAFIAFGYFTFMQFTHLMNQFGITRTIFETSCSYSLGIYSWPVLLVATLLVLWLWADYVHFVFIAFALAQLIQIIMIIVKSGNILLGLVSTLVYIITSIATVAVIGVFMSIFIIVMIGLFILCALLSGSGRSYVGRYRDRYGNVFDVYE